STVVRGYQYAHMTWVVLIGRNLLRRPARTVFTVAGVGLGVGLIVALLSITNGVHRTASRPRSASTPTRSRGDSSAATPERSRSTSRGRRSRSTRRAG